jgi:hypothetical protein
VSRVETNPRRSEHEVDVPVVFVAPELEHAFQIELAYHIVSSEHGVHVGLQSKFGVYASLIELDLYEAIRVRSYDEVDLGPVYHDNLLDVVDDIWQLLLSDSLHALIHLRRFELSVQDLVLLYPL